MNAALEWRLAYRYLRARTDNRFLSFIAGVGVTGIAVAVAVLLVVLSVMNGFEKELRDRILGMASHATLTGIDGPLPDWRSLAVRVERHAGVHAVAPYVEDRGMIALGPKVSGALVRGVLPDEEVKVSALGAHVSGGTLAALQAGRYGVILGRTLAEELGAKVGDRVVLAAPQGTATPAGVVPRMRRLTVVGLLNSGMYEYDRNLAIVHMVDAARIFRTGDGVTGLRLAVDDPYAAGRTVRDVAVDLGGGFFVSDWTRQHANFFRSIQTTKGIMFVILLLVVAVAAFNIVSTLVMLVREKQGDIAILRTLGLAPRSLLAVFVLQGTAIGALGVLAGLGLGLLIADNLTMLVHLLERLLGTTLIDARVYYIDELPAVVTAHDAARIGGLAFVLACLSTLYPAWRAARTQPAQALRHE
jgi:lipoprotein-releasing system permease protein